MKLEIYKKYFKHLALHNKSQKNFTAAVFIKLNEANENKHYETYSLN